MFRVTAWRARIFGSARGERRFKNLLGISTFREINSQRVDDHRVLYLRQVFEEGAVSSNRCERVFARRGRMKSND